MADIQYLNYGDQQIEQQAFLNKAANEVQNYVQSQPWSRKRKEKFMSAYSDLMNRGVLGASNSSGQWVLDIGGDDLGLDSKNTKDKEMYQEAAYFIQQQMAGMPTKSAQAEEEKKDLPVFDNKYFTEALHTKIGKDEFGGRDWDTQNDWNNLDARGENGLRGKSKRAETLSRHLQEYANSLEEGKYNFEGSPFTDLNDFRARIGNAVEALKNPDNEEGVTTALNRLGLRASDYFNNGSGDLSNTINPETNQPFTYSELAQYNQQQAELKQKQQLQAQQQAKKNAYNSALVLTRGSSKLKGMDSQALKAKYQDSNNLIAALQGYSQRNLNDLTPDEQSELHGIYKNLANAPIDNKLLKAIQATARYKGASPNRFRKINGVDGFIFDTLGNQVIQVKSRGQFEADKNQTQPDLFANVKTQKDKQQEYLNNTDFTASDWAELTGIGLDIASIVDPEPWTAGGMGLLAAGARNYARAQGPEDWGFWDYASQAGDYLTGLAGAIPGLGDAALISKTTKNVASFLKTAMRVPAFLDLWNSTPELIPIGKKIQNGESLSVQDWMNLGTFFRGLATTRNLNVANRAQRRVLQKRGYEVSNRWDKKIGLTRSTPVKPKENVKTSSTKPESTKVEKPSETKVEEPKVKEKTETKPATEGPKGKIAKSWNTTRKYIKEKLSLPKVFKSKEVTTSPSPKGNDTFDEYLKSGRSNWDKFKYGSNRTLKSADRYNEKMGFYSGIKENTQTTPVKTTQEQSQETQQPKEKSQKTLTPEEIKAKREVTKNYREFLTGTKDPIKEGATKVGDTELKLSKSSVKKKGKETFDIHFGKIHEYNLTQQKAKQRIKELIKQYRKTTDSNGKVVSKKSTEEIGKILKDLKKRGWYKQGGNLNL